jgi:hypothetical protein
LLWLPQEISFALENRRIIPLLAAKYLACVMYGTPDANVTSSRLS